MADDLYLEPNRKAQIIFVLVIILGILLFVSVDPILHYLTPSQGAPLEDMKAGVRQLNFLGLGVTTIGLIIQLFWVSYFGRQGFRTLKQGRYPPADTIVIRRTRIRTGKYANLAGYLSIAFAILMGLLAIQIGYILWIFISIL